MRGAGVGEKWGDGLLTGQSHLNVSWRRLQCKGWLPLSPLLMLKSLWAAVKWAGMPLLSAALWEGEKLLKQELGQLSGEHHAEAESEKKGGREQQSDSLPLLQHVLKKLCWGAIGSERGHNTPCFRLLSRRQSLPVLGDKSDTPQGGTAPKPTLGARAARPQQGAGPWQVAAVLDCVHLLPSSAPL